jgi:magnesium transporter
MDIQRVKRGRGKTRIEWITIPATTQDHRKYIQDDFPILEGDLDDVFDVTHRSKMVRRDEYVFVVLMLPVDTGSEIVLTKIDILVFKHTIITIHAAPIPSLEELFDDCQQHKTTRDVIMSGGRSTVLAEIIQQVFEYTYPLVDNVSDDIERLQTEIFSGNYDRSTVEEILHIKQDIIDMRRAMRGHRDVLHSLSRTDHPHPLVDHPHLFEPLLDDAAENWSQLESLMESIDSLEDANESLLAHDLNGAMKMLTLFSVLLLPAAVIAGVFGINATHMPFIGHEMDFWIILCCIGLASGLMWVLFRFKQVLK